MGFFPDHLLQTLNRVCGSDASSPPRRCWVAYSGGADSHALLHALAGLRRRLEHIVLHAVHVDHGLHAESSRWATHCQAVCAQLEVPCKTLRITVSPEPGDSIEAAARRSRYRAIAEMLAPGELVLTAHTRDDQAETLLLQLLRGAGPRGLAAMPELAELGAGQLLRPLLVFERAALRRYAEDCGLRWIEDPSNADIRFDRNYLRHEIEPGLRARWPGLTQTLTRAARHQAEAAELLDELAALDLEHAGCARDRRWPWPSWTLRLLPLRDLSDLRQRNALRHWLRSLHLPVPDERRLHEVLRSLFDAGWDRSPQIRFSGIELRRYRDTLFVMPALPQAPAGKRAWDMSAPLELAPYPGTLHAIAGNGEGIDADACRHAPVTVRFGAQGLRCRLSDGGHRLLLKKLFQSAAVPPWWRGRIPLIFLGDDLAAVAGLWVCAPFRARPGRASWRIHWASDDPKPD